MKYIVLVLDGASDHPVPELGGLTPFQAADIPNIDGLCRRARLGLADTVPESREPGSDVANLSIMGYDPDQYFSGRAPYEAASLGIELADDDLAFRCNLVTVRDGIMVDYSSSHISTEEAREVMLTVQDELGDERHRFYPGLGYRHIMVCPDPAYESTRTVPPHDFTGGRISEHLPVGHGALELRRLMEASREFLPDHPVNRAREAKGLNPANSIWLWGQGMRPHLRTFGDRYGLRGAVISAVDLIKGIGKVAGLEVIDVPGATGYFDTDYEAKARYALDFLKDGGDFIFVHVESPDEAGHVGNREEKVRAIESIDRRLLAKLLQGLDEAGWRYRFLIMPDHPTPLALMTHTSEPVPFAICGAGEPEGPGRFDEETAAATGWHMEHGHEVMDLLIG